MKSTDIPYERLPDSKSVPHVEVPTSVTTLHQQQQTAPKGLLRKACCCLSLATGVRIVALLDLLAGIFGVLFCIFIIVARTQEHAIDHALEKSLESLWGNSTNATQRITNTISQVNDNINLASRMVSLLLIVALITSCFGIIGMRAASGSSKDALCYYVWKVANAIATFFSCSIMHIIFTIYVALMCRSHWLSLALPVLPVRAPVIVVARTTAAQPDKTAS